MMSRIALIRKPSPLLDDGIVDNIEKVPVDVAAANQQWDAYVKVLQEAGWHTVEVEPADDCPDSVFVEDTVVMYKNVAVITRPGADARKPETAGTKAVVKALGCSINEIQAPGTLDGGDVLKIGDTIYVGRGGRTNAAGINQLRKILSPLGARVVAIPVSKVLHLKSAVTALPDGTIIGYEPYVDDVRKFPSFVPVPEAEGAAVLCLSETKLLISASAPQTAELLRDFGYEVIETPLSEFEKLEGCPTCLSVRIRCLAE
ncbi:N(G),N(G)-dimethylarginine dimethylaminohydrolase [Actinobaculum suis]|nr:N(G),N(G)-dimethylarginine dimethylaminohydrolase [Actinobaculum suis]OCA96249.1 N(G),N(G)-dimethylarginine dimethylaminohydrolase [Actinobaculum suis]